MGLKFSVDDEPLARDGLKLLLRSTGHRVRLEARNAASHRRDSRLEADLVLLDVQMPRVDGFAVVHSIGADRCRP
jgi:CheY-like chemotaxis protein